MKKYIIMIALAVTVIFPAADSRSEITKEKKQEIADKLYEIELSGGDHLGYCSEILQHLEKSSGIRPLRYKSNSFDDIDRLNLRGDDIDLYSLLSGGLAIRESLQLESIRQSDEGLREIDPSVLVFPVIQSHPFNKMLENREYKTYPIDKYSPDDFYYVHFNSVEKGFNFLKIVGETGGALHKRFTPVSVDFMTKEKLLIQLALRESSELSQFYKDAISEIVITGSDPFITEGSDVSLIIRTGQSKLFNQGINSIRRFIKDKYSAKEKEIVISEFKGSQLYTDDRKVWSFLIHLTDGTVIISNSIKAAEKIADTYSGKLPSISDAPDYRYVRSIYPADQDSEDGFIYLSDKFIRYLISPQLRIKEARRMYEEMKISVLEKYMIFHYQLTGKFPLSIEELMISAGGQSLTDPRKKELSSLKNNLFYDRALKLDPNDLSNWSSFRNALTVSSPKTKSKKKKKQSVNPDDFIYDLKLFYKKITGDQAYTPAEVIGMIVSVNKPGALDSKRFEGLSIIPDSFSAKSNTYGRINSMIPLIEIEIGNISKREAEEYKKFAESYNTFWKDYFDPIGIRVKTGPVFSIETCILPLVNNSIYNLLSSISGGKPVELHPDSRVKGDTFSMAFKVNPLMIKSYFTIFGLKDNNYLKSDLNPEDIFTGEVQFHMSDALPLADFNSSIMSDFFADNSIRSSEVMIGFLAWSFFHPVRIAIPVKKSEDGFVLINSIINKIIDKNNYNNYLQSENYMFSYNKSDICVIKLTFFNSLITRIYIAEKDNVIHIATTEKYIKDVLDLKPITKTDPIRQNAAIVYRPSEMILEKETYRSGMIENGLQKSKRNSGTIKLMGLIFPDAESKDIPDLAYRNFGFKPVCPLGGDYIYNKKTGDVRNSVYGSGQYPVFKLDENSSGIVPVYLRNFFKTTEMRVELEFTPEGIKTKIISR